MPWIVPEDSARGEIGAPYFDPKPTSLPPSGLFRNEDEALEYARKRRAHYDRVNAQIGQEIAEDEARLCRTL